MIRSELREAISDLIVPHLAEDEWADDVHISMADEILSIPHLKEALDFYEACQSAFEVNGEFKVTKETLRGKGGVSAS